MMFLWVLISQQSFWFNLNFQQFWLLLNTLIMFLLTKMKLMLLQLHKILRVMIKDNKLLNVYQDGKRVTQRDKELLSLLKVLFQHSFVKVLDKMLLNTLLHFLARIKLLTQMVLEIHLLEALWLNYFKINQLKSVLKQVFIFQERL